MTNPLLSALDNIVGPGHSMSTRATALSTTTNRLASGARLERPLHSTVPIRRTQR